MYSMIRTLYRCGDRVVLQHLPDTWNARVHGLMFRVARRLFPARITARSASEFSGSKSARLPAWARGEVQALAAFEPLLGPLVTDGAAVEHYVIPWDMRYVGDRYAAARRQLQGSYACMLFMGGDPGALTAAQLAACARPLAIVDVDGAPATAQLAREAGADYVALPAGDLDLNDQCAVLARLALQCAPPQLRHAAHPVIDACIQRHGLALASVAEVLPWPVAVDPGTETP